MELIDAEELKIHATHGQHQQPPDAAEADEEELMVKVADKAGIFDQCTVDYDPFIRTSSKAADAGSGAKQHLKDRHPALEGASVKQVASSDEPEWIFIGGSQQRQASATNISAETSHFIMKRSSVTKIKEAAEAMPTSAAAAAASVENT